VTSTAIASGGVPAPVAAAGEAAGVAASPQPAASVTAVPPAPATAAAGFGGGTNGEHAGNGIADPVPFDLPDHEPAAIDPFADEPLPRVQLRPGGDRQRRPAAPSVRRPATPRARRPITRGIPLVVAAIVAVAVIVGLVVVVSGGGGKSAPTTTIRTTNAPSAIVKHKTVAPPFNPSSVSVAVLNGTATAGLAAKIMQQLAGGGYKQGITPTNASSQTQQSTVVAFEPGHRTDAVHVARALSLSSGAVAPVDTGTQAIACPQSTSCPVEVVVTVGQDLTSGG
jgi:hypothetical protein